MRRYTQRRDARNGQRHTLAEDMRMAALEALLPAELERHCQLQRSRLDTYQKLREAVVLHAEARGHVAMFQPFFAGWLRGLGWKRLLLRSDNERALRAFLRANAALGQVSKAREDRDDPMDVGGFGQWKGRNSSKERERMSLALAKEREQEKMVRNHEDERTHRKLKVSWNCGRTSHQIQGLLGEPWQMATATESSQGHPNSPGKGSDAKGRSGKGGGKKGKSKDAGALVRNQQPSPVASSVASSTPQTETSTTVGTVDAIECTALDLCATTMARQEVDNPRWIAFNVDTGAGGTVWPMNADCACEKVSGPAGRNYKTATGEMVEVQGRFRVRCQSVWGHQLHIAGEKTSVHKPLWSAGDVADKGHALWLDGNVGYIIQKDLPILTAMRTCFQRVCEQNL